MCSLLIATAVQVGGTMLRWYTLGSRQLLVIARVADHVTEDKFYMYWSEMKRAMAHEVLFWKREHISGQNPVANK